MFTKDQFISDCQAALTEDRPTQHIRDIMARAVSDPSKLMMELGTPRPVGFDVLIRSPGLTILNAFWGPGMSVMPHDHAMAAVIGVYTGREDNILWRRLADDPNGQVEAAGAKSIGPGETLAFGADSVHSVLNPLARTTGALHVYLGDFFGVDRHEWDSESLYERPYDMEKVLRMFASN